MKFKKELEIYLDENNEKYAYVTIEILEDNTYNISHTFVSKEHRGEGLAAKLMEEAIKCIKNNKGKISTTCSYAEKYLEENNIL